MQGHELTSSLLDSPPEGIKMKASQEEGVNLSHQKEPPEQEVGDGGDTANPSEDPPGIDECGQEERTPGQGVRLGLVETPPARGISESAKEGASDDAPQKKLEGAVRKEKEPQNVVADTSNLEESTEGNEQTKGEADNRSTKVEAIAEGFRRKEESILQEGDGLEGTDAHPMIKGKEKELVKALELEKLEELKEQEEAEEEKLVEKKFGTKQDAAENQELGNLVETEEPTEESRTLRARLEAFTERYEARASMEVAAGRVRNWGAEPSEDADVAEIPNPPGSVGYFFQSSSLRLPQTNELLKGSERSFAEGLLHSRESSPAGQPDAASWQQQVDRLSEDEEMPMRAKRGEGLKQDLNVEWVASVAEADQAQNAVTKNLEAQLVLLQKVAATRYGEETAEPDEPEKESHAETMRKLKAELAALEEKAAAQKLMKRQPGFAELRTSSEKTLASEKPEKPAKKPRERYWKLSDEEIREGLEAKRKRRPNGLYMCQVEGCEVNLENAKAYNKRHHVCWEHSRAWEVNINGLVSRFCQQCSRFHDVREFDEIKRSCRERLLHHNKRRRTIADPNRKSPSEPSAEGEAFEAASRDEVPRFRKKRAVRRGSSATEPEPEEDPVQKALFTLMRAREQLGGAENPLAVPPPERLPHFGGLRESDFRGPPGAYGLDASPVAEPGVNRLASLRHDSTELTLARRGSGLSGFAEISVQPNPNLTQPLYPQSGVGLEPTHDPSFEALVQNRLQQFLHSSSQQQLRSPESHVGFPDRTKQFASEVASRSPLLAAYVQGLDSFTSRGGQNGSAPAPPSLATPLSDFLRGEGKRPELFEPTSVQARAESFLDPNQLGAIYRSEEPVRENRLLRLMSESAAPLNWGRAETPTDPLTPLQQFAGQDLQKGGVEREQNEALHREFTRLIQLQSQNAGDGTQTQAPLMNLFRQPGQDPLLESKGDFKLSDWSFQ